VAKIFSPTMQTLFWCPPTDTLVTSPAQGRHRQNNIHLRD
jgi:hypothetical protein